MPNRTCGAIGVIFACWTVVANSTGCGPDAVTGLFRGLANPPGSTTIDVMLNLSCVRDAYVGQLFTSMGDFAVKDARARDGHVDVDFDSGASLGTLHLTAKGKTLDGLVDLAGEHGTVRLKKVGPAQGLDALKPKLDLSREEWRADLHFLAIELPKRHANAFFRISGADFDAEITALDRRIETANSDEIFVGLRYLRAKRRNSPASCITSIPRS